MNKITVDSFGLNQHLDNERLVLGLDAEVVPLLRGKKPRFPHQVRLQQIRPNKEHSPTYLKRWSDPVGDWHGDGFAFEVCTAPTSCLDDMMRKLHTLFTLLGRSLQLNWTEKRDRILLNAPTLYHIPPRVYDSVPGDIKKLGCALSFNVYDDPGDPNSLGKQRTTGCHLHISHSFLNNEMSSNVVKWADILVGNTWVMISPEDPIQEARRRESYGRAGEFRRNTYPANGVYPRSTGVEYRVLPGRVLTHPAYLTLMFNLYRQAVYLTHREGAPPTKYTDMAREAINRSDREAAAKLYGALEVSKNVDQIITWYRDNPLPVLSLSQWNYLASNYVGFRSYYISGSAIIDDTYYPYETNYHRIILSRIRKEKEGRK